MNAVSSPRPPSRNGVGASCVALQPGPYACLLDFLVARFVHVPRETWVQRLQSGKVLDEAGQAISLAVAAQTPYWGKGRVFYFREVDTEPAIPVVETVLFQDELILVVDKPSGLPVVPSGQYLQETVLVRQKKRLGLDSLVPVHRIDRDTAGLVLFCLQPQHRRAYSTLFAQRQVEKIYEALAPYKEDLCFPLTRRTRMGPGDHFMLQQEQIGAPNTCTHIELIEHKQQLARYRLRPESGHRHQLRVHLMALGIPIVNDGLYPTLTPEGSRQHLPLQLLARSLSFVDPINGQKRHFSSQRQLMTLAQALSAANLAAPDRPLG